LSSFALAEDLLSPLPLPLSTTRISRTANNRRATTEADPPLPPQPASWPGTPYAKDDKVWVGWSGWTRLTCLSTTEQERAWRDAVRRAESSGHPLRFLVYKYVYLLNLRAQKVIDLLEKIGMLFGLEEEQVLYHQALMHQVRASASSSAIEPMAGIEHTEEWLFDRLRKVEEKKLLDPDDVDVRIREQERIAAGHPPRIQFLDPGLGVDEFNDPSDEVG